MRRSVERGASAVEFALIVPVLLALLFGIIDFGFWFADSINVRQGVREGARIGSVATPNNVGNSDSCGLASGGSPNMRRLACKTKAMIGAVSGPAYVKVDAPASWSQGESLLVCGMVQANGVTGVSPLPRGGIVRSKVVMSVELATPGQTEADASTSLPAGLNWNWCVR